MAEEILVDGPNVKYGEDYIVSTYKYESVKVDKKAEKTILTPTITNYSFRTARKVPKLGVMIIGLGGNNGTTVTGGIIANKLGIEWNTKEGHRKSDFFGSLTQSSVVRLGVCDGAEYHSPLKNLLPMVSPTEAIIGGWDISKADLAEGMKRAQVLDYDLQRQLEPEMKKIKPLPSIYYPDFIAANQEDRADNIIAGNDKWEHVEHIRKDIRTFKEKYGLDKVVILWSANTERFSTIIEGVNDNWVNLEKSIRASHDEVSQSTVFCVASILEGCTYINGSPQNTFVPGALDLAGQKRVMIAGDDFKSGQTKFKSCLVDFFVSAGIKPVSIVSYNHLGNNDGKNLSAPKQFRSKEISKSNVVDDMVDSNKILFPGEGEKPDHCVVIKYVPYVGDSKRALDEYTSEIFMGGKNTIVSHNTCEDSLLAAPLIIDLFVLGELISRIEYKTDDMKDYESFHPVMSVLGYLLKAPMAPAGTPIINALFKQRSCIENILRACIGLGPENNMLLEYKCFKPKPY